MGKETPESPMTIDVQFSVGARVNHVDNPGLGVIDKRRVRPTKLTGFTEAETITVEYHVRWDDGEDNGWYTYASLVRR